MIKNRISRFLVYCLFLFSAYSSAYSQLRDYTNWVKPFIGTVADGNTFPGASLPFGGVKLSSDSQHDACGGYAFADNSITFHRINNFRRLKNENRQK